MDEAMLRKLTAFLGLGTVAFGVVPFVSPGGFARLFGLAEPEAPTVSAAFRSVGARDLAVGMGLWSSAVHGGKFAPWLLARVICDVGDTIAAVLAIRAGERNPRFLGLSVMAAGAAGFGFWLWQSARRAGSNE